MLTKIPNIALMGSESAALRSQGTQPTAEMRGRLERSRRIQGAEPGPVGAQGARAHGAGRRAPGPERLQGAEPERTGSRSPRTCARAAEAVRKAAMAPSPQVRVLRCCCCRLFQTHQVGRAPASSSSWLRDQASCPGPAPRRRAVVGCT